jgi:hypothetical protein
MHCHPGSPPHNMGNGMPLFFKVPLIGTLSAEWCSKRSFPHKVTRGLYRTLGED